MDIRSILNTCTCKGEWSFPYTCKKNVILQYYTLLQLMEQFSNMIAFKIVFTQTKLTVCKIKLAYYVKK